MTYQDLLHIISLSTSGRQTKNNLLDLEILQKGIGLYMHAYVLQVE